MWIVSWSHTVEKFLHSISCPRENNQFWQRYLEFSLKINSPCPNFLWPFCGVIMFFLQWDWETWMIPRLLSFQRTYNFSGARLGWGIHLDPPLRMRPLIAYPTNPGSCFRTPRSYTLNGVFESHIRTNKGKLWWKPWIWKSGSSLGGGLVLWEGYLFLEETVRLAFKVKLMEIDRNRCF